MYLKPSLKEVFFKFKDNKPTLLAVVKAGASQSAVELLSLSPRRDETLVTGVATGDLGKAALHQSANVWKARGKKTCKIIYFLKRLCFPLRSGGTAVVPRTSASCWVGWTAAVVTCWPVISERWLVAHAQARCTVSIVWVRTTAGTLQQLPWRSNIREKSSLFSHINSLVCIIRL